MVAVIASSETGADAGFHMGNDQRKMRFTAFCQMDFVADPGGASLLAVMCLFIVRRADISRWWRNLLRGTPTNDIINVLIILHPHLSQDFDCRNRLCCKKSVRMLWA